MIFWNIIQNNIRRKLKIILKATDNACENFKELKRNICIVLYHILILNMVGNGGWNGWK